MTHAKRPLRLICSGTALICLLGIAAQSNAQAMGPDKAPSPPLGEAGDEIVVTARSSGETLQSVPVAVTAMTGEALERYKTTDIADIAQQIPQVTAFGGAGSGSGGGFVIRGLGTTGEDASLSQSVGIVLDGIQVGKAHVATQAMYDLQQVEVLKGPQALFFGKNNPAGVISLKSRNPGQQLEGYVRAGYEFEADERYAEAAFGGPVTDTLGVRFAGRYSELRGWVRNLAQPRSDPQNPAVIVPGASQRLGPGTEAYGGRLTMTFEPSSNFRSVLKVQIDRRRDKDPTAGQETVCAPGQATPVEAPPGVPDLYSDCRLNGVRSNTDLPPLYVAQSRIDPQWRSGVPFGKIRNALYVWNNAISLDDLDIVSNTGFQKSYISLRVNAGVHESPTYSGGTTIHYRNFSQEIRLITKLDGPLNFTLGGFYEKFRDREENDVYIGYFGPDATTGNYASSEQESVIDNRTISLFGQVRYDIAADLELSAGARYTKERKRTSQHHPYLHSALSGVFLAPGVTLRARQEFSNISPEATLTWTPSSNTTLYAAFKTGYKSGGVAVPVVITATNTVDNLAYRPEKAIGGEIGYKGRALDRRLRFDITAYYYNFKGLQLASYDAETISYRIQNATNARQKGIEGTIEYQATDALALRAAFGFNSLKYGRFPNSACYAYQTADEGCVGGVQDLSGRTLSRAPKFAASAGATFDQPIGGGLKLGLATDATYTSRQMVSSTYNPTGNERRHLLYNASIRLGDEDDRWELSLIGRNLGNKRLMGHAQDRPGGGPGELEVIGSRPRQIVLQASVNF